MDRLNGFAGVLALASTMAMASPVAAQRYMARQWLGTEATKGTVVQTSGGTSTGGTSGGGTSGGSSTGGSSIGSGSPSTPTTPADPSSPTTPAGDPPAGPSGPVPPAVPISPYCGAPSWTENYFFYGAEGPYTHIGGDGISDVLQNALKMCRATPGAVGCAIGGIDEHGATARAAFDYNAHEITWDTSGRYRFICW